MGRTATGQIRAHTGRDGLTYRSLRFRAYGKRRFVALGAVSEDEAERQLRGLLADVERGIWQPEEPAPEPAAPATDVTFHDFAEQWWSDHEHEWRANTRADYRWRLEVHLLPFFRRHTLAQITVAEVDRYRAKKLSERPKPAVQGKGQRKRLTGASINKTLVLLSAILETAVEHELIERNAAAGRRRRVKTHRPTRSYLDSAGQIAALLDAARELDTDAPVGRRHIARHAMLATLTFAGLRISELLSLRWQDVDLASGRLRVGEAKTDAGVRQVRLRPALREALVELKASRADVASSAYVFATSTGKRMGAENVRNRVLAGAVKRANKQLEEKGEVPLPKLTPHSLRRTFASVLYAIGEPPPVVMAEMGHTDAGLALRIYAQAMRSSDQEKEQLRALVEGESVAETADMGTPGHSSDDQVSDRGEEPSDSTLKNRL